MCYYVAMSARVLSLIGLKVHSTSITVPVREERTTQKEACHGDVGAVPSSMHRQQTPGNGIKWPRHGLGSH